MSISPDIGKTESADEKKPQTEKGIYGDTMAVQLAETCKYGDISAMQGDICFDEFFRRLQKEAGKHQDSEG